MRKLLLTPHQVSILLTCFIALTLTTLLFSTGVLLQHRTVSLLRSTLPPSALHNPHSPSSSQQWSTLAHIQPVTAHSQLCASLLLFSHLHTAHSPARRILLFPLSWASDLSAELLSPGPIADPYLASSRRLLRLAARRYGVELRPVAVGAPLLPALGGVERALAVRAPGLPLRTGGLDALLASGAEGVARRTGGVDAVLLDPAAPGLVLGGIDGLGGGIVTALDGAGVRRVGELHAPRRGEGFNRTAWVEDGVWAAFVDEKLPLGPEVEVPFEVKREARPRNKDAEWLWTSLYGDYAERRREVCGLGLEGWYH